MAEKKSSDASLNACVMMCDPCRRVTMLPLSKLQLEVTEGAVVIKFVCDHCHAHRVVTLKRGVDF